MDEPQIEINGTLLNPRQTAALRATYTSYLDEMSSNPDALGRDNQGRQMTAFYIDRLREILRLMRR